MTCRLPRVIVPQDAAVFKLVADWMDAPSDTSSAMGVDEWRQAWSVTCRRMLDAQAERDRYRKAIEDAMDALAVKGLPYQILHEALEPKS